MPPVRRVERKGGFLVADGRNNAATVAQTELLRGADPLVVWERRCKGLDWLGKVFPEIMTQQLVGGVVRRGILYSELEYVLGGVVRIHEGFRGWEFKNTLLHPGFLTDVSTALGEDERFDTESGRTSLSVLARQVADFATRVLEDGDEKFTANEPGHFLPLAPVPLYDATGIQAEGLTFGMLVCPVTGRLCEGAAVLTWFGCRYQPAARRCDNGEVGVVVEAILTARRIFTRKEPDKATLAYARGGGRAFLAWVIERGLAVGPRVDDIEPCKVELRVVASLIDRLNHQEKSEVEKSVFLCQRLTRLLKSFPLLKAMIGSAADVDIARMVLQLHNALLAPSKLNLVSAEAQVAEVEDALGVYEERLEALSAGGPDGCDPAMRVRTIIEVHAKFEKADKVKDLIGGGAAGESLGLSRPLVSVLESQSFKEVAASIETFMEGTLKGRGNRREKPLDADVFLKCMAARYRFLTGYLLGKASLSMQATEQSSLLAGLAKVRMTGTTLAEVKIVAEAVGRVLLLRDADGDGVHKSMLGFSFSHESCLLLVTGKWSLIDWETFLIHEPAAHKMSVSLGDYYSLREAATGKGRAMKYTSLAEMTKLKAAMSLVFDNVLGYGEEETVRRSFGGVMNRCLRALEVAATLPVQACDIMVKVSTAFNQALDDAGRTFSKWVSSQLVDAPFPPTWLPKDSDALMPLKHTLRAADRVADNTTDLPFCAMQTSSSLSKEGESQP